MNPTGEPKENARAVADAWFTPGRFLLFLSLLIFAKYPRVVLGLDTFFYRDYGLFTYPIAHYFRECFWRGELPLWNPLNECGVPLLAQWNTAMLYPPSLFYLILPLPWSLALFNLLHLLFAGLGMYFLAWRWTKSRLGAAVAGAAFAFNGLSFHMLMWISNLAAYAWMPWVVLFTIRSLNFKITTQKNRADDAVIFAIHSKSEMTRATILAGFAGAMQMLSGAPEIILLTWLILAVWWLAQFWRKTIPRTRLVWRMALVCLLVAGLSAAQLLPFLELLAHSQRDSGYGGSQWSMPGWGWANFLVPLFHCTPAIIGVYSQDAQQWTSSYYMGIGIVALAMLALWRKQPRIGWLALAAVAGVVLAMGDNTPVYGWVRKAFPFIGVMRYPVKIVVLTAFALPLLAGFGVGVEGINEGKDSRRAARKFIGPGIFLLLLTGGILMYAHAFPIRDERWSVTCQSGVTRAAILALMLGAVWAVQRGQTSRIVGMAGFAIVLLVSFDALTHMPDQNPTLPNLIYGSMDIPDLAPIRMGESRAKENPKLQAFLMSASTPDRAAYYVSLRRALFLDSNLIDDIPTTSGFFSVDLRPFAEVRPLINRATEPLADFLGVSRVSAADTSFTWMRRTNFMPMVTCGQKPMFAGKEETLNALASPAFNPRETVYLPESARGSINITNQAEGRVTMRQFSAQKIECELEAKTPVMVVVSQVFYAPWHAYIDGERVPLWQANGAFQGFAAPAGKHEIRLAYEDTVFKVGAAISLLTLLAAGFGWFFGGRARLGNS